MTTTEASNCQVFNGQSALKKYYNNGNPFTSSSLLLFTLNDNKTETVSFPCSSYETKINSFENNNNSCNMSTVEFKDLTCGSNTRVHHIDEETTPMTDYPKVNNLLTDCIEKNKILSKDANLFAPSINDFDNYSTSNEQSKCNEDVQLNSNLKVDECKQLNSSVTIKEELIDESVSIEATSKCDESETAKNEQHENFSIQSNCTNNGISMKSCIESKFQNILDQVDVMSVKCIFSSVASVWKGIHILEKIVPLWAHHKSETPISNIFFHQLLIQNSTSLQFLFFYCFLFDDLIKLCETPRSIKNETCLINSIVVFNSVPIEESSPNQLLIETIITTIKFLDSLRCHYIKVNQRINPLACQTATLNNPSENLDFSNMNQVLHEIAFQQNKCNIQDKLVNNKNQMDSDVCAEWALNFSNELFMSKDNHFYNYYPLNYDEIKISINQSELDILLDGNINVHLDNIALDVSSNDPNKKEIVTDASLLNEKHEFFVDKNEKYDSLDRTYETDNSKMNENILKNKTALNSNKNNVSGHLTNFSEINNLIDLLEDIRIILENPNNNESVQSLDTHKYPDSIKISSYPGSVINDRVESFHCDSMRILNLPDNMVSADCYMDMNLLHEKSESSLIDTHPLNVTSNKFVEKFNQSDSEFTSEEINGESVSLKNGSPSPYSTDKRNALAKTKKYKKKRKIYYEDYSETGKQSYVLNANQYSHDSGVSSGAMDPHRLHSKSYIVSAENKEINEAVNASVTPPLSPVLNYGSITPRKHSFHKSQDILTPCQGVCWDPTHQRWVAHWSDAKTHQRIRKYFNPKLLGFERAKLYAILTRKEAVDSGRASMMLKSTKVKSSSTPNQGNMPSSLNRIKGSSPTRKSSTRSTDIYSTSMQNEYSSTDQSLDVNSTSYIPGLYWSSSDFVWYSHWKLSDSHEVQTAAFPVASFLKECHNNYEAAYMLAKTRALQYREASLAPVSTANNDKYSVESSSDLILMM